MKLLKRIFNKRLQDSAMPSTILGTIAEDWAWTGLKPKKILLQSDFANFLVQAEDGKVWLLLTDIPECTVLSDTKEGLSQITQTPQFFQEFELGEFGNSLRNQLGDLKPEECYSMKVSAALGGKYEVNNFKISNTIVTISFAGQIGRQIADVPNGTEISITVK